MIYREPADKTKEDEIRSHLPSEKPYFVMAVLDIVRQKQPTSGAENARWKRLAGVDEDTHETIKVFDATWMMARDKWEAMKFSLENINKRFSKMKTIALNDTKVVGLDDFGWFKNHRFRTKLIALWSRGIVDIQYFGSDDKYAAYYAVGADIRKLCLITEQDLKNFYDKNIPLAPYVFMDGKL